MAAGDINQLTISGHVDYQPQMHHDDDGKPVCEFLLTHVTACPDTGAWELQHYDVTINGPQARAFVDTYQPGDMIVIAGRLDCQDHLIPLWLWKRITRSRRGRPHDYARSHHRTYVSEPIATITAYTITTSGGPDLPDDIVRNDIAA